MLEHEIPRCCVACAYTDASSNVSQAADTLNNMAIVSDFSGNHSQPIHAPLPLPDGCYGAVSPHWSRHVYRAAHHQRSRVHGAGKWQAAIQQYDQVSERCRVDASAHACTRRPTRSSANLSAPGTPTPPTSCAERSCYLGHSLTIDVGPLLSLTENR